MTKTLIGLLFAICCTASTAFSQTTEQPKPTPAPKPKSEHFSAVASLSRFLEAYAAGRSTDYQVGILVLDLKLNKKGKEVGEGMLIMPRRSRSRKGSSILNTSAWIRSAWQACVRPVRSAVSLGNRSNEAFRERQRRIVR